MTFTDYISSVIAGGLLGMTKVPQLIVLLFQSKDLDQNRSAHDKLTYLVHSHPQTLTTVI